MCVSYDFTYESACADRLLLVLLFGLDTWIGSYSE